MNSNADNRSGWEEVAFIDSLDQLNRPKPKKIFARDYKTGGKFPVVDQGQKFITGWTDDESLVIKTHLPLIVFGDHTRVFKFVDFPFVLGADGTQLLKPKCDLNPHFFYYACLNLSLPNRGYNRHFTILKEQHIPRPPLSQQTKIAALLHKVQQAIEIEKKLIAAAREFKQSAMQKLFAFGLNKEPQKESEIGLTPESWGIYALSDLREFLQYGTSAKCDYPKKGNPVLRIPNIIDGKIDCEDMKWCELSNKEIDSWILEEGDVVFIRTNGVRERVGTCAVYHGQPERALFASYLIRARLDVKKLNPDFFQYYTSTAIGTFLLGGRASPAADGKFNINTKAIDSLLVPLPSVIEQKEIVSILQKIDRKISVHNEKRKTLQELFEALLKQLMTGQLSIVDLQIDTSDITS